MSKISLKEGSKVAYNNEIYEVLNPLNTKSVIAKNINTNKQEILDIIDIKDINISQGSEVETIEVPLSGYEQIDSEQWEIAKQRYEIIKPLLNENRTAELVSKRAKEFNSHISTLYRWIQDYESSGLLSSLVPKHFLKGAKGVLRTKEETELIITKAINDLYLTKQKYTAKQVYIEILRRCKNARINPPHENTVRNRILELSAKKVLAGRESRMTAERRYRNTDGMFPEGTYPLDVIQIDHTPIDIIVVDEKYRQPVGRPYLTLAIDVYSRMIVGFYISLEEPSYFSVAQCLSCAILSKDKLLRELEIEGEWNIWGIPKSIHMDNAQEFRGTELQRSCEQYGITITWRPVARPQYGGHIERMVGTTMREIHKLPGSTFANIKQKGEYNPDKEAIMTLHEVEKYLVEYFVNIYHKKIHSSINMTPEQKFEFGLFGDEDTPGVGLPEKISDEDTFKISLLPTIERTIQQFGVTVDKISYYADCLRRWIKAKTKDGQAKSFIFKRDPRDISTIWFFDPDIKRYFPIPYRNITYPPISVWELRAIHRYLEEKNLPDNNEEQIFNAYAKMNQIQEEAAHKTKIARKQISSKNHLTKKKRIDFPENSKTNIEANNAKESSLDELFNDIHAFDEIEIVKDDHEN